VLTREQWTEKFVEVIAHASSQLPPDVLEALKRGRDAEEPGSLAAKALDSILTNVEMAKGNWQPICQDTGTPLVWIHHPVGMSTRMLTGAFEEAVRQATGKQLLRPNAVDTLTEKNTGHGQGPGIPTVHCEEWDPPDVEVRVILKGGGCENCGAQYSLPNAKLKADRTLDGVSRCILDAIAQAQGKGCAPGIIGASSAATAARGTWSQAAAPAPARRPHRFGAETMERNLLEQEPARHRPDGVRRQDHGSGRQGRQPRSAARLVLRERQLHVLGEPSRRRALHPEGRGAMAKLTLPSDEATIRKLKVGDFLELSGRVITGRDSAHTWLLHDFRKEVAPILKDSVIYHVGPVVKKHEDGHYSFVAAGPTTSAREEPYQADVIGKYGLRGVIGKGGMGPKTLKGLQEHGAVYLHAVGGTAQVLAEAVKEVEQVFQLKEFGVPEALWVIRVENFPVVVTMDAHGNSLHAEVEKASKAKLEQLLGLSA
jgi:fumarate hydratase class I